MSILLLSCRYRTASLSSETIFSIPIGVMRDEINLFSRRDFLYSDGSSLALTPFGDYFIVDRSSHKILYYSNYGKLNYIIYNPDYRYDSDKQNPQYLDKVWYFGDISEIAVSLDKLYVTSTPSRHTDTNLAPEYFYAQFILTFNDKGEFLYQLGSEGKDSKPFLYSVTKLFVDRQGRLFVIARHPESYYIYEFSEDGELLGSFELSVQQSILANPAAKDLGLDMPSSTNKIFYEITSPNFSYDGEYLFFELYSYKKEINKATLKTRQLSTYGYDIYSVETVQPLRSLKKNFTVRDFKTGQADIKQMYGEELMGMTSNNLLVFLQTYPDGRNVLVYYDTKGDRKYIVTIDVKQQLPYKLYLAPNGLVSALNFYEDRVSVSWWRTDKLFGKELPF